MKPGDGKNVLATLDRKSELKVLWDVIDFPGAAPDVADKRGITTFARFRDQARNIVQQNISGGDGPGFVTYTEWAMDPVFDVMVEDRDFVQAAAKKVLSESNPVEIVSNVITGRLFSAFAINRALGNIRQELPS